MSFLPFFLRSLAFSGLTITYALQPAQGWGTKRCPQSSLDICHPHRGPTLTCAEPSPATLEILRQVLQLFTGIDRIAHVQG